MELEGVFVLLIVGTGFAIIFLCTCWILRKEINRGWKLIRSSDDNPRRDIQQQAPNQQTSSRLPATSTREIEVYHVGNVEHIIYTPRQSEIRPLPHPQPDYPPASRNAPTRPNVYELPGYRHAMQSVTRPRMPTCVICQDRQCDCCLDCGHLLCNVCAWKVRERDNVCPVCRELFTDIRMIYPDNSVVNNSGGASQSQKPTCTTGICPGLECDSCLSCGHMLCYVCACQLEEMGSKCHICHKTFTDIRRIYY